MSKNENELSLDDLENVSGGFVVGGPVPVPRLPVPFRGGHSGTGVSIGGDNTQLGSDDSGPADGGSGGYFGDGNYLRAF